MPRLAIDRIRRRRSASRSAQPDDVALVIVARIANALTLTAVSEEAARGGLTPGMALTDARAIHPGLDVVEADADADGRLLAAVADWCERFTPFVALDSPGGLLLDLTGAAHLFGGEEAMRRDILDRLSLQGLTATAAIAGTADAAKALSRFTAGGVVRPGGEEQALGFLPVAALDLEPQAERALQRAGLYTIADVAARPRAPLAARFGRRLLDALDGASGRADTPLSPRRRPPSFSVVRVFADPVADKETIDAVMAQLAGDLAGALEREGQGARRIEAAFFRADGAVRRIAAEAGLPVRDPALMTRLFRERLDALADPLDPGFGFDLIRLAALAVAPLAPSADRFDGRGRDARELTALVDRLGARFGVRRVVGFCAEDTHVPEASARVAPHPDPLPASGEREFDWPLLRGPAEPPARPLRLFDPPQPIEALAEVPDGPPGRFRWRRAFHVVVKAEGPERIAMEWWRRDGVAPTRDYFRVEDDRGRRFWLFREGLFERDAERPRWFLHGLFA